MAGHLKATPSGRAPAAVASVSVGTWDTGAFDNDDALDLLDALAEQPAGQRSETLGGVFTKAREHPEELGRKVFPAEVVAAAALVAASLPGGDATRRELASKSYDVGSLLTPASARHLIDSAREALLLAAGQSGPWHDGWTSPEKAAAARQTTDELAAIFRRERHSHDQELPFDG